MVIFAWILFVVFILDFLIRIGMLAGSIMKCLEAMSSWEAYRSPAEAGVTINVFRIAIDISAFVFVCLYLFC